MPMEKVHNSRVSQVALATLLFLVVAFDSPPSTPSIPVDRPAPPTAEEVEALAELSEWVLGGSSAPSFRAFSERTLPSAFEGTPMGFELFRGYHGEEAQEALVRGLPFGRLIAASARRYGLDPLLLVAMAEAESSFDPNAISAVGAVGLMQLMPTTAELYTEEDPFEPTVNIDIGARYLRDLLKEFEGDTALALAAYNSGPGNVVRYQGVPPFRETRRYVERVMALYVDYHQTIWQESPDRAWFL
jgi:soluble lytic murein transglycosylase-like protein